jgi:hypothetical protein
MISYGVASWWMYRESIVWPPSHHDLIKLFFIHNKIIKISMSYVVLLSYLYMPRLAIYEIWTYWCNRSPKHINVYYAIYNTMEGILGPMKWAEVWMPSCGIYSHSIFCVAFYLPDTANICLGRLHWKAIGEGIIQWWGCFILWLALGGAPDSDSTWTRFQCTLPYWGFINSDWGWKIFGKGSEILWKNSGEILGGHRFSMGRKTKSSTPAWVNDSMYLHIYFYFLQMS